MGDCVEKIVVRHHFSFHGRGGGQDCSKWGPSLTDQSFAKEADVNWIVSRFMKSGVLPSVQDRAGVYGDFSDVPDYHAACDIVLHAQHQFDGLDARLRRRFNNDPAELLAFVNDPANVDEAIALGIMQKRVPEASSSVSGASKSPPSQPDLGSKPASAGAS